MSNNIEQYLTVVNNTNKTNPYSSKTNLKKRRKHMFYLTILGGRNNNQKSRTKLPNVPH